MLWAEVLPWDIMRVLRVQPWYEGASHSHGNAGEVPFVSLSRFSELSSWAVCADCVKGWEAEPEAGGGAVGGERGWGTSVMAVRARAAGE